MPIKWSRATARALSTASGKRADPAIWMGKATAGWRWRRGTAASHSRGRASTLSQTCDKSVGRGEAQSRCARSAGGDYDARSWSLTCCFPPPLTLTFAVLEGRQERNRIAAMQQRTSLVPTAGTLLLALAAADPSTVLQAHPNPRMAVRPPPAHESIVRPRQDYAFAPRVPDEA